MSECIWVRTDPDIDGVYRVELSFDEDTSYGLSEDSALVYAMEVLRAVAHAEYDAAVLAQMQKVIGDRAEDSTAMAASIVADLREDRPATSSVTPLRLIPGVSAFTGEAFLKIELAGKAVGQWSPGDARGHALAVLESVIVAELDSAYLRLLRSLLGLEEDRARNVVGDLANYRKGASE